MNSKVWRAHKFDSGILKRLANPLHCVEVGFYPAFEAL